MAEKISSYIFNDLRARILSGADVPAKWTISALANRYRVSAMPVRVALGELRAKKLLCQSESGRFSANPEFLASQKGARSPEPPKPPADPYQIAMDEIIERSLRGDATPLRIVECAKRYAVSPSRMHTIFHRLAGVGLLDHAPRQGWTVRPFRQRDLDAYVDVREALELLALDSARDGLDVGKLKELLALNQPGALRGKRIDNSLHAYWVGKSGNRYVQDFFQRHQPYYDLLLDHAVVNRQHIELSKASHRGILEALIARDWPRARAELSRDIRRLSPLLQATSARLDDLGEGGFNAKAQRRQGAKNSI